MNTTKFNVLAFVLSVFLFTSCDKDDGIDTNTNFDVTISGLENLGSGYAYEGWLIVNGAPVTTGTFTVDDNGVLSQERFNVLTTDLTLASTFVLTIEPSPDNDPTPSDVHILAGDFSGNNANLSISHGAALNNDFTSAVGTYILATPTNGMSNDENSGIWFLDLAGGSPSVGLDLPALPAGWAYEGWAVIAGTPVSTGTFTSGTGADAAAPFSGSMGGPAYPGEDFIMNAPSGLSFPTDLAGGTAVISIEPVPDNSAAPFLLKPLVGPIPANAVDHTNYPMNQNLSFPTGTVSR